MRTSNKSFPLKKGHELKLRLARLKAGLSQAAAAKEVGISKEAYHYYETGRNKYATPNLGAICKALGLDLEDLLKMPEQTED